MNLISRTSLSLVLIAGTATSALAQWYAGDIDPGGMFQCVPRGGRGNLIVGYAYPTFSSSSVPELWVGTTNSSPMPVGATAAVINRTDGWDSVGYASGNGVTEATMWYGQGLLTASLAPPRSVYSVLTDLYADRQVGAFRYDDGVLRAGIWNGSTSVGDLHPSGYEHSAATGIYEDTQVGRAMVSSGEWHACCWKSDVSSFMDMHPSDFAGSAATDAGKEKACGFAYNGTYDGLGNCEAMVWNTSSGDATSIQPGGYTSSKAWAINSDIVAGFAVESTSGAPHAGLWNLRSGEFVDLQPALDAYSPFYIGSMALDVWYQGDYIKVCGFGYDAWTGMPHAVIWLGRF